MNAITERDEILQAYEDFAHVLSERGIRFQRSVGYQGGSGPAELSWRDDLQLWVLLEPDRIDNRFWCAFGVENPEPASLLPITCEINPPKEGVDRRCAGLFVRDHNGALVLVHSGKIGGGRPGIGKEAFLNYLGDADIVSVSFPGDEEHEYVSIGRVHDADFMTRLANFVHSVARFKEETVAAL